MKQDLSWVRKIKLQQLRTVMAVARSRSLISAADDLGLSQPAVTKILHELESELGAQLFVRTSRGTHPTPLGMKFAERAQAVFAQLEQSAQEIYDIREGLIGHGVVVTLVSVGAMMLSNSMCE